VSRRWLVVGGGVCVLCLVAIVPVLAQGPGHNPVLATIEYVDQKIAEVSGYVNQEIDRLDARIDGIGSGGGGPDFETPESWWPTVYAAEHRIELWGNWCTWNGAPLRGYNFVEPVEARGIATHNGNVLGYGFGTCTSMFFDQLAYVPDVGETIQLQIWYSWMGGEETVSVPVTIVNEPPQCRSSSQGAIGDLQARFEAFAFDPEGGEVTYLWEFGDETTAQGGAEQIHTYPAAGLYRWRWTAVDSAGLECENPLEGDIEVY